MSNDSYNEYLYGGHLYTPSVDSLCGIQLEIGETYVVAGRVYEGKPRLNLCNLAMRWSEVTKRQRKGFKGLYAKGCICDVSSTVPLLIRPRDHTSDSKGPRKALINSLRGAFNGNFDDDLARIDVGWGNNPANGSHAVEFSGQHRFGRFIVAADAVFIFSLLVSVFEIEFCTKCWI